MFVSLVQQLTRLDFCLTTNANTSEQESLGFDFSLSVHSSAGRRFYVSFGCVVCGLRSTASSVDLLHDLLGMRLFGRCAAIMNCSAFVHIFIFLFGEKNENEEEKPRRIVLLPLLNSFSKPFMFF